VADPGPAEFVVTPKQLTDTRTLLISNQHFQFERIDLAPNSAWCLEAQRETWLFVIDGSARVGSFDVVKGDAVFAQWDRVNIRVGAAGLTGLAAYTGNVVVPDLLQRTGQLNGRPDAGSPHAQRPIASPGMTVSPTGESMETTQ